MSVENQIEICWFCGINPSKPGKQALVEMHRRTSSESRVGPLAMSMEHRIEYKTASVDVPRCEKCADAHSRTGYIIFLIFSTVATTVAWKWLWHQQIGLDQKLIGTVLIFLFGSPLVYVIKWLVSPRGIKAEDDVRKYPPVNDLLNKRYDFGAKPHHKTS